MGLVDERVAAVGDGALGGLESSLDRFHEALRATEEGVFGQVSPTVLVHELGDTRAGEPSARIVFSRPTISEDVKDLHPGGIGERLQFLGEHDVAGGRIGVEQGHVVIRPRPQGVLGDGKNGGDATAGRKQDEVTRLSIDLFGVERAFRRHHVEDIPDAKHIIEMLRGAATCDFLDGHLREFPRRIDQVVTAEAGSVLQVQTKGDPLSRAVTETVKLVSRIQRDKDAVWSQPPHLPHGAGMGLRQGSGGGDVARGHEVCGAARAPCARSIAVVTG